MKKDIVYKGEIMELLYEIFGKDHDVNAWQVSARAAVTFIFALILIRFAGLRMFKQKTPFDVIVVIMLGSILSRGVLGVSSIINCVVAVASLLILSAIFSWLCRKNKFMSRIMTGKTILLFENGQLIQSALSETSLTEKNLKESLREHLHMENFDKIEKIYLESNGRVSFVLKEKFA